MPECDIEPASHPLHLTTRRGHRSTEALRALLELRADPNAAPGYTCLPALSYALTEDAVELLVQHRADVNLRVPPLRISPLTAAAVSGASLDALQRLLDLKADVNACQGGAGMPVLAGIAMSRICPQALDTADLLVKAGADLDLAFQPGGPFRAVELCSRAYASTFKELPLAVRWFSEVTSGSTALGVACFCGNEDMVEFLMSATADPNVKNNQGQTPMQLVRHAHLKQALQGMSTRSWFLEPTASARTSKLKQRRCVEPLFVDKAMKGGMHGEETELSENEDVIIYAERL